MSMTQPILRSLASTTVLIAAALAAMTASADYGRGVSQMEKAMLPTFCWKQMGVPNAIGPEFEISGCGSGMNHYCPGLVKLQRAKRETSRRGRENLLNEAETATGYTDSWMTNYPNCPIRPHLEATKAEIKRLRATLHTLK